ncbi:MAG: class I SAM-dependent methyltransferase [Nannocystaceae bacterium]|nr:methyltransferase domain-containing protein [bacterium]
MRLPSLAILLLLAPSACDKGGETTSPVGAPDADDGAASSEPAEDPRLAAAERDAAQKLKRWTPELRERAETLRGTEWSSLDAAMDAILPSPIRTPGNADRDAARHPRETLAFFGLTPSMHVFEVGQGAGWYTEILAPLLAKQGRLYLAGYDANADDPQQVSAAKQTELFIRGSGNLYEDVELVVQPVPETKMGEPNTMDMVLVFRMMHNVHRFELWDAWMKAAHTALKPGGVLAIVQHRAADDANPDESAPKGYMPEPWLIEKVESYGFELEAKSDINANPKDTKDYDNGVWQLPPTLAGGDEGKDTAVAIGESDRSTLKFVKVD